MSRNKYRVWCKNRKQWEKDDCMLSPDGRLFQVGAYGNMQPLSLDNHIIEWCTGLKDSYGNLMFEGDILSIDEDGKLTETEIIHGELFEYPAFDTKEDLTGGESNNLSFLKAVCADIVIIGNIHDTTGK